MAVTSLQEQADLLRKLLRRVCATGVSLPATVAEWWTEEQGIIAAEQAEQASRIAARRASLAARIAALQAELDAL